MCRSRIAANLLLLRRGRQPDARLEQLPDGCIAANAREDEHDGRQ
jgi:hypothetical protein